VSGYQLVRASQGVRVEPLAPPDDDRPHVEMIAAGLCGTDVQIAAGTRGDVATVLGHEGVGLLRDPIDRDRLVVFNPVDVRHPDAILGHSFDGLFRSWVPLGPELPVGALHEVRPVDPVALLALCEPLATVLYTWELIGPGNGPMRVGVWGAGPIGLLQAGIAVDAGHDVTVVHPSAGRRRWLRDQACGAALHCVRAARQVKRPLDVAVLCVPKPAMGAAARDAAGALDAGGLIVLVPALDERAAAATFTDPTVGRVRWRNQCGRIDAGQGTVLARTCEGKLLRVTGHRGTSLAQLGEAERRLRRDRGRFEWLITHRARPVEAVRLINARCAGSSHDEHGTEIVKLVIDFTPDDDH
jgi:D-arabinose 1-dehydrogenase-like Zn-dependent alcohol dehydrogenase